MLDQWVAEALGKLKEIEGGYRAYHAAVTALVRQYPGLVQQNNKLYEQLMCGLLHVEPGGALAGLSSSLNEQLRAPPAAGSSNSEAVLLQGQQQQPGAKRVIAVPGARGFRVQQELLQALLTATPKPWMPEPEPEAVLPAAEPQGVASATGAAATGAAAAGAVKGAAAAAAAATTGKPSAAGGKLSAAAAAAAAAEAEAAAAAAAEKAAKEAAAAAEKAARWAAAVAGPHVPESMDGVPLCEKLVLAEEEVQEWLQKLKVGPMGLAG